MTQYNEIAEFVIKDQSCELVTVKTLKENSNLEKSEPYFICTESCLLVNRSHPGLVGIRLAGIWLPLVEKFILLKLEPEYGDYRFVVDYRINMDDPEIESLSCGDFEESKLEDALIWFKALSEKFNIQTEGPIDSKAYHKE